MYLTATQQDCIHETWFEVRNQGSHRQILYTDRLERVVNALPHPRDQYPDVVLFVGQATKDAALAHLFPADFHPCELPGARIHVDSSTRTHRHPRLFVDLSKYGLAHDCEDGAVSSCHTSKSFPLDGDGHETQSADAQQGLVSRLLLPFVHLTCIFADDFGGLTGVRRVLEWWDGSILDQSQYEDRRSRLVIFTSECPPGRRPLPEFVSDFRTHFDGIELAYFSARPDRATPTGAKSRRQGRLSAIIAQNLDAARMRRVQRRLLFSAIHYAAIFTAAMEKAHELHGQDLLMRLAHGSDLPGDDFIYHVSETHSLAQENDIDLAVMEAVLGSALLLMLEPPGAHHFEPKALFDALLDPIVMLSLARRCESVESVSQACKATRRAFCKFSGSTEVSDTTPIHAHARNLREHSSSYGRLYSNTTCLCCLNAAPDHPLCCGHSLCASCLRVFGTRKLSMVDDQQVVVLHACPICNDTPLQQSCFRYDPPTAGIRLLTIDGGGVKGIVPLSVLAKMQAMLGEGCRIQDMFDLCMGTSAGGLVVLRLFLQEADLPAATTEFCDLSSQLFESRTAHRKTLMGSFVKAMKTLTKDELYDGSMLDTFLQRCFGDQKMFEWRSCQPSKPRVGAVATAVDDKTTAPARIFSNYNGRLRRSKNIGYRIQRSMSTLEPQIWEAARATSAAPGYFKPAVLPYGAFQDGCMLHNNPINVALWETSALWPRHRGPDVVVSLGCGQNRASSSPIAATPRLSLRDAFPFRVARSFWSSLDGELVWRDLMNRLDPTTRQNFFRLSPHFDFIEPALDDPGAMGLLQTCVQDDKVIPDILRDALMALCISSFYFELDSVPIYVGGLYRCRGFLRCRSIRIVTALLRLFPHGIELFEGHRSLGVFVNAKDICRDCHNYFQPLVFSVPSLHTEINLHMCWDTLLSRNIGAMPSKLSWFMDMQNMTSPFRLPKGDVHDCVARNRALHAKEVSVPAPLNLRRPRPAYAGTKVEKPKRLRTSRTSDVAEHRNTSSEYSDQ